MAAAQGCSKCTAQKKGFRRELDSWRNTLIHCVGFESILEGIYGPMLLRDLSIFDDCEPEELDNWSMDASCSFCNLQLDKLDDHVPAAASPLSSPSDDTTSQAPPLLDSNQSAHRFLHAVLHKKDVPSSVSDPHLPLVAQELMRRMIHQFALEYASKGPLYAARNGLPTAGADTGSPPLSRTDPYAPLDLTVSRHQENLGKEPQPDGVLDLSKRTSACSSQSPSNQEASGRQCRQREEYAERSWELSEGLLSKAMRDVRSGSLEERRAALLYGIPPRTLRRSLGTLAEGGVSLLRCLGPGGGGGGSTSGREEAPSQPQEEAAAATQGGEARLLLQRVAAWAERAEPGGGGAENGETGGGGGAPPPSSASCVQQRRSLPRAPHPLPQPRRDPLDPPASPPPDVDPPAALRIPRIRASSNPHRPAAPEPCSRAESLHHHIPPAEGTAQASAARPPSALLKLRTPLLLDACLGGADLSPSRSAARGSSLDDSEEGGERRDRDKDKPPRKKRGRYRQYDHDLLEEAITMVMGGRMSVSRAQGVYGIPHSTLEYKVKERSGTLKIPPKRKHANPHRTNSGTSTGSADSGSSAAAAVKRF